MKGMSMSKILFLRVFSVLLVLTKGTSYLAAANLTAGTSSINLSCTKGTACTYSGTSTLAISAGTGYFNVTAPSSQTRNAPSRIPTTGVSFSSRN